MNSKFTTPERPKEILYREVHWRLGSPAFRNPSDAAPSPTIRPKSVNVTTVIRIAAALLLNGRQQLLLVRKRGTSAFMQPGGKIDGGEQPLEALIRELHEELSLVVAPEDATFLGHYQAPAANEPGCIVDCALYRVEMKPGDPAVAAAEIEEAVWVSVAEASELALAPLTREVVLPLVRRYLLVD